MRDKDRREEAMRGGDRGEREREEGRKKGKVWELGTRGVEEEIIGRRGEGEGERGKREWVECE